METVSELLAYCEGNNIAGMKSEMYHTVMTLWHETFAVLLAICEEIPWSNEVTGG